jgi:two-component system nitrate/nitrite response regulator NarL
MRSTTIFLADHHPLFRQGLISILKLFPEFRPVGDSSTMADSLKKVQSLRPDIVILGSNLHDGEISEAISWVKQSCPTTKIIILTESENINNIIDIIEAGASGYLVKGRLNIKYIIESIKLAGKKESPASSHAVLT